MGHRHKAVKSADQCFHGTARGAAERENRTAHGGICRIERCECGAQREINLNAGESEVGCWYIPGRYDPDPGEWGQV
jgi:hypothetical protein